jgi:hypothetical protein
MDAGSYLILGTQSTIYQYFFLYVQYMISGGPHLYLASLTKHNGTGRL